MPSTDMKAFQRALSESKHIIAVAGAGLSAASGIPTFRGAGGMWRKFDATSLATPGAFRRDPSRVWQFYHYRREKALLVSPNAAHHALVQLSIPSFRYSITPKSTFTLITQNVDGLSARALDTKLKSLPESERDLITAQQQPVLLEMHGRLYDVECTSEDCGHIEWNVASPICPALAGTETLVDEGVVEPTILEADLPHCAKCGALARPGVVWFGERPVHLDTIDELVEEADMCLVVGTSSTVYPAAAYAGDVQRHGGKVAVFNIDRSDGDGAADYLFLGPCEETLPQALGLDKESLTNGQ
ncbi:DHS-like NAD/FAD-binding domain-containing protein [Fomitiporia mediterranea MF3/22]|uniref:DHS-like NAD/FAD-binding domain-containing protein n=1 Tax=Fomitiporia mediterranea (strain MF3/22) TaxID=694068 RepID=UPI00044077C2|nr:DHS-like NAD/FAD-binding domain-containing protein [Fomitiporia mediterranea MF3/22]EJD00915.1 DHS-like NAD/FAD-binding domain-containing protein [Fomitiporia mediterranea MF3/22]